MQPILVTGAGGTVGSAVVRVCRARGLHVVPTTRAELDIADTAAVAAALAEHHPWAVVNAAGFVGVEDAEREPARCRRENFEGAVAVAEVCAREKLPLLTFSSDQVFDGEKRTPYLEADPPMPLGALGRSKADAERALLDSGARSLVVRTSTLFGPWDGRSLVSQALEQLGRGSPALVPDDVVVSPTYLPDLVNTCLDLLLDGEEGLWHLVNEGGTTWSGLVADLARRAGLADATFEHRARAAVVPAYTVLRSGRGRFLPPLADALTRYLAQRGAAVRGAAVRGATMRGAAGEGATCHG